MKVLVVSGIWPPDVGGPATHAPEVADFLRARGHEVEAVVTADREPDARPYPVRWTPRRLPAGLRHLHAALLIARRARRNDVVYATGMFGRVALACLAARAPYVLKLTADPAFERARWRGSVSGGVDEFQRSRSAPVLRRLRDLAVRHAAFVFCPSAYLRDLAIGWGAPPDRVELLPNPAPAAPQLEPREALRHRLGFAGPTLVFAGRLTAQKALDDAFTAVERCDGVQLVVAGDGPDRERLERLAGPRVTFAGAAPRDQVLQLFAAADASLLASGWENFPHSVLESLAVGTPVIATDVGGVAEVVQHEVNGLLVPPGDVDALAEAIRRLTGDDALRERLRAAARGSVERYAPERLFARLEAVLEAASA